MDISEKYIFKLWNKDTFFCNVSSHIELKMKHSRFEGSQDFN